MFVSVRMKRIIFVDDLLVIPSFAVIGRGGEMITKLQADAGAKIQVAPGTV